MADPEDLERGLTELRETVRELTARTYRLEQALRLQQPPAPATTLPLVPPSPPVAAQVSSQPLGRGIPTPSPLLPIPPRKAMAKDEMGLESRIGSHWLNRIGISAVLIGVAYFLKFAFDNNWIGPAGRVAIGLIAGIAVVIWSERFRNRGYNIFSYSLKAVGIGAMYLSLWAAFQVYNLFPGSVAFVAMLIVTAATATMALTQDAEILAAFALTGGFVTPVLLSTGQNREVQLFAYVGLLDLATLVLVIYKPWRRLLVMSFTGTLLLYLGWYSSFYSRIYLDLTATFATFFFAVFAVAPLVGRREAAAPDFPRSPVSSLIPHLIAFANAVVYFLQVFVMLQEVDKTASAWFALALAGVYIFLSRQVRARYSDPQVIETLHFLHLALALGFITIAIPIRLDGHWITMGWFVEAGILLWVADRIKSDFLNLFAIGALVLGVARLLLIDDFYVTDLMFNWRITTHIVAIAVLAMIAWYGSQREDETGQQASRLAIISINVLALEALSREVIDYFSRQFSAVSVPGRWNPGETDRLRDLEIARHFTFSALWMGYGAMLMIIGFWRRSSFVRWQALVLIAATIFKVFTSDVWQLDRGYRVISFIVLGVLLLAISFGYQRDWLKLSANQPERESPKS